MNHDVGVIETTRPSRGHDARSERPEETKNAAPVSHLIFVLLKEKGALENGLYGKGVDGGEERNRIQIMGRSLRIERAGGWYHVTGRGNERRAIFQDKRDRFDFVGLVSFVGDQTI